jgi:acyl-ACP thioesterase
MASEPPPQPLVHTESFVIRVLENDSNRALFPRSLCDFLQEAADRHVVLLGVTVEQLQERSLTWVLSRLRLRIQRLPAKAERLTVRTWHAGIDRLFSLRDYVVTDAEGAPVASAITAWLAFDLAARKPIRVQGVFKAEASSLPRAMEVRLDRLPGCGPPASECPITVRWSDLDINRHVNNSRYAEWLVEGAGEDLRDHALLQGLDLDFLAETQAGGTVVVRTGKEEAGALEQTITRGDGVEVARGRTTWRRQ